MRLDDSHFWGLLVQEHRNRVVHTRVGGLSLYFQLTSPYATPPHPTPSYRVPTLIIPTLHYDDRGRRGSDSVG